MNFSIKDKLPTRWPKVKDSASESRAIKRCTDRVNLTVTLGGKGVGNCSEMSKVKIFRKVALDFLLVFLFSASGW